MAGKLDQVLQDLIPLAEQGEVTRSLHSTVDIEKLSGLVEDIHDTIMDYQVSPWKSCADHA